jgi:4-amino-4-deoxy-L-arabinose transferase-like glycosyltransferase
MGPKGLYPSHLLSSSGSLLIVGLIALAAVGLRAYRLDDVPVFYDEDRYAFVAYEIIYLSWTEAIARPMNYLETGIARAPLVLLGQAVLARLTSDTVLAGRIISIASAAITTALTFWLGRSLAGPLVGVVASLLYAVAPVSILHEQMGLQDGPLTAVSVAAVLAGIHAIDRGSRRAAGLAALLGGVAVQCKPPGVALALIPPLFLMLWPNMRQRLGQAGLATAGPALSYAAVALGPLGASMAEEDSRLRLIQPLATLPGNLATGADTLVTYFGFGLLACVVAGRAIAGREAPREAMALSWAIIVFIVPWLILSRFAPSRYYVPVIPYLCAFAAVALVRIPRMVSGMNRRAGLMAAAASAILLGFQVNFGLTRALEPRTAQLSWLDGIQYQSGWPAGFAYMDAARFIRSSVSRPSTVAYAVDPGHRMGAGVHSPLPDGIVSLGLADPLTVPRQAVDGRLLVVMVDDGVEAPMQRSNALLQQLPALRLTARFEHPGSALGVSILTGSVAN